MRILSLLLASLLGSGAYATPEWSCKAACHYYRKTAFNCSVAFEEILAADDLTPEESLEALRKRCEEKTRYFGCNAYLLHAEEYFKSTGETATVSNSCRKIE